MYESVLLKRRSADKTSKQDKIDDLVMNCVFADADGHKQLSLLDSFKPGLLVDQKELPSLI